jgi:hypothetical protein
VPESDKFPGKPRSWVEPLIYQLCSFTGERSIKHDDHVDQTTQALRLCMDKRMIDLTRKPRDDWKGDRPAPTVVMNPYAA